MEDEGALGGSLGFLRGVAYELVGIGSNQRGGIRVEVEINTVHNRSKLVLSGGKQRTVDVLCQQGIADDNLVGTIADALCLRILVSILYGQ